ncbi:MAG: SufE family protein, partial [Erythrobacter sp.]
MRSLSDILEEYAFLEGDERYGLLIELGRELEPMPEALKTEATLVRGCSAAVWVYPAGSDAAK